MNLNRLAKQATVITLSTVILLGGSRSETFAAAKDPLDHNEKYGTSQITRYDMQKMINQQGDAKFTVPKFDESTIKKHSLSKKV